MAEFKNGTVLLDYYRIVNSNARQGATSTIMKAYNDIWKKDIAVKIPDEEFFSDNKNDFFSECRLWTNLPVHPYIIQCHFAGAVDNTPMLFLEWCDGSNVKEMIADGSLYKGNEKEKQNRILSIAMQSIAGIEHAHANGVIHKDIKPQNIMVKKSGIAKLTDFGSAVSKYNSYTCEYCSPEQLAGKKVTAKTDVFSWAVTCMEMFCGKCSWSSGNEASNFFEFITNKAVVKIPPELKKLLHSALSVSPSDRPDSESVMKTLTELFGDLLNEDNNLRFFRKIPDTETDPNYLNNKAINTVIVDGNDYKKAITYLNKAISINPELIHPVYNKYCILWVNGEITADEFVNVIFDHESASETYTEEVLSVTQFSMVYAIDCKNSDTGESYRPFRFSADGNNIIFYDDKNGTWKIIDIADMKIVGNFTTEGMPTLEELEAITNIEWDTETNTDFLSDRFPRINGLSDYSPEQLYNISCMSRHGYALVVMPEDTAYICFRSANANCRLSQAPMPSSEEMADAYLKSAINKLESEKKMSIYYNGEIIGNDTIVLENLSSNKTNGVLEEIYTVYSYSLDKKLRMHVYFTEDINELEFLKINAEMITTVSVIPNIAGPIMTSNNDRYIHCFYDEYSDYTHINEAYIRGLSNDEFFYFACSAAINMLIAINSVNNDSFFLIHGSINPEALIAAPKEMYPMLKYFSLVKLHYNANCTPTGIYIAPEYKNGYDLTSKTDIYLWAVTLLTMIAWRENSDANEISENSTIEELRNYAKRMDNSFTRNFKDLMNYIAMCITEDPDDRPDADYLISKISYHIGSFFDSFLYFTTDNITPHELNNLALSDIHNNRYADAQKHLSMALKKYPEMFSANFNRMALEVNMGNKPISDLKDMFSALGEKELELARDAIKWNTKNNTRTINLTDLKDPNGYNITCHFSDKDILYASHDGSMLILELAENNLTVLIDIKSGRVIDTAFGHAMNLMIGFKNHIWNNHVKPFCCNENFRVIQTKDGILYGPNAELGEKSDEFGSGFIEDITGAYTFFTDFTEETPIHKIAGVSGNDTIKICDFNLTACRYIISDFFHNSIDLSKLKGYEEKNDVETRLRKATVNEFFDFLDIRTYNCLNRNGIYTVGEFLDLIDDGLNSLRNFSKKSFQRVCNAVVIARLMLQYPGGNVFYLLDYTFLEQFLTPEVFDILKAKCSEIGTDIRICDLNSKTDEEYGAWLTINPEYTSISVSDCIKNIREGLDKAEKCYNMITMNVNPSNPINETKPIIENSEFKEETQDTAEVVFPEKSLQELITANNDMCTKLLSIVKGQDHVVHKFCNTILDSMAFSRHMDNNRPLAVFTFAGPPGVGKTFLAEQAAKLMGWPCKRFDMTEFSDHQSHQGLIGFEFTWTNSQEGSLTSFVRNNPKSILIFDEIEKAHKNVIHLFFQILEAGMLTDKYHATCKDKNTDEYIDPNRGLTSFKNTIIIFTTNAGRALYEGEFSENCAGVSEKTLLNALSTEINPQTLEPFFPTAMVSRISTGCPVIFNNLKPYHLTEIIKSAFDSTAELVKRIHDIEIQADNDVILSRLFANGGKSDARQLSSNTGPFFRAEIKNAMEKTERYDIKKFRFTADIDADTCSREVYSLFRETKSTSILIYSSETIAEVCGEQLGSNFTVHHADNFDAACMIAEKYEIDVILLDIAHRDNNSIMLTNVSAGLTNYSAKSASAWKDGYRLFKFLREKMSELPIYLLEDTTFPISNSLLSDFVCAGARDKIPLPLCTDGNDTAFADTINSISNQLYMEKKALELSQKSHVLTFDTAPMVKEDEIVIEMRNFELKFAVDADDAASVLSDMERPDIRFKDVIGAAEAKESLKEFIKYLQNPKSYTLTGKTVPKGVLLYGDPGTGKTMLAKAMAGECNTTFIPVNASDFVTSLQGSGPASIHELFQKARRYAPSIVFIDEVDSIAKDRTYASETTQTTLNALLAEMDGFNTNTKRPVFVIAATNYDRTMNAGSIGKLDDAFMRRFDRPIKIELPDKKERMQIIYMLLSKLSSHAVAEKDVESIAERTAYISPAILTNIFQAALRKVTDDEKLSGKHLDEALETEMYGKEYKCSDEDMLRTARHECGHALLYALSGHTPAYLTVVARGNFNGYMQMSDKNLNERHHNKQDLLNKIRSMLAGRAAEMVYYGNDEGLGTGASSDLERATALACSMVTKYGMDEEFGLAVWQDDDAYKSPEVRKRVNEILKQELDYAMKIIELNKTKFDKLVAELVKENSLSGYRIKKILGKKLKTT